MDLDAEVGVVGTGTMGSMGLWQLARRGISALGFEQFTLGHDRGAGAGETRQFWADPFEPEVVQIMAGAAGLYRELEAESGMRLLHITGGLTIGPANSELITGHTNHARSAGVTLTVLSHTDMRARFPQHKLAEDDVVLWHPESGFLRPEHAIVAASTTAERLGARIVPQTEISRLEQGHGYVAVYSGGRRWLVRRVVLTAGPWTWSLLPALLPEGELGRLLLTWFPVRDDESFGPARFPTFTRLVEGVTLYGMPQVTPGTVRIGPAGPTCKFSKADELVPVAESHEIAAIESLVARCLPTVTPVVIRTGIYHEGYTPDGMPIIGTLPGYEDVLFAAGFSGRGFKMAPVIGSILADLVTDGRSTIDLSRFALQRFRRP